MHILIAAATPQEIGPLQEHLEKTGFATGKNDINVLASGIGAAATTFTLTEYCTRVRTDLVIQGGICGSFSSKQRGKVFAVTEDCFSDMGVQEGKQFKSVFDLGLLDPDKQPFHRGRLPNPYQKLLALSSLRGVRALTVNEITTGKKRIQWYKQHFSARLESMEGAACHYACLQLGIPFIQVRAVSNDIGERDKEKWKMTQAIRHLNEKLIYLLTELSAYDETHAWL